MTSSASVPRTPRTPTLGEWVAGARPRTLPISIAPVIAGSAIAYDAGGFAWLQAILALAVSIALQIGVNFANDYSDGIRGTDAERVGPMRLVGSGLARPKLVKAAAFTCFGVAAVLGLVLIIVSQQWWLLIAGAASILAAWYYTGGSRPYGYRGLGEVFVFVFFGLVAVLGTTLVQLGRVTVASILVAVAVGLLAVAVLVSNNLRDIAGDTAAGKRTLATRIGDRNTRRLFAALAIGAAIAFVVTAGLTSWWALLALVGIVYLAPQVVVVLRGATGPGLLPALKASGLANLFSACGLAIGMFLASVV